MRFRRDWIEREVQQGTDFILHTMGKAVPSEFFVVEDETTEDGEPEQEKTLPPAHRRRRKLNRKGKPKAKR